MHDGVFVHFYHLFVKDFALFDSGCNAQFLINLNLQCAVYNSSRLLLAAGKLH